MAKKNISFICSNCKYKSPKWLGKCPNCNSWNSFEQRSEQRAKPKLLLCKTNQPTSRPELVSEITHEKRERILTGVNEFDRVLGGGIFPGSITLIGGAPGVGKSTLLTSVLGQIGSEKNGPILYISGEESKMQVAERIRRLKVNAERIYVYAETNWQKIENQIDEIAPGLLVIDSIQTMLSSEVPALQGSASQIREVTYELLAHAKLKEISCFVIGHITKEGNIAGPKNLEHMVDTVIYLEGDPNTKHRMLRAVKNRFGSTNEIGLFEMNKQGLSEVSNAGQYFLNSSRGKGIGRSISCIVEGARPVFVEAQALVIENSSSHSVRTTQGIESNRLAMLVAVIEKYLDISLKYNDVYINIVGGIKFRAREMDMSIIASILSSYFNRALDPQAIFLGEVGLTGEIHPVENAETRIKEIEQLNYRQVYLNDELAQGLEGKFSVELIGLRSVSQLMKVCDFC